MRRRLGRRSRQARFNPRSGPRAGAIELLSAPVDKLEVSIRAPVRGPERSLAGNLILQRSLFQSALRSEGRSDGRAALGRANAQCFNPRSGPRAGAIITIPPPAAYRKVSIRAPVRGPERYVGTHVAGEALKFQSALRSEGRSDVGANDDPAAHQGFNPRSGPRAGAMIRCRKPVRRPGFNPRSGPRAGAICERGHISAHRSFNPRSGPRAGAIWLRALDPNGHSVSIRAPVRGPERWPMRHEADLKSRRFQSALRSEGRSDPCSVQAAADVDVSIRAPVRGPERCARLGIVPPARSVSIRAPVRGPER